MLMLRPARYVNDPVDITGLAEPKSTSTSVIPAVPAGRVTTIEVPLIDVIAAEFPPISTPVASPRFVPVIVTGVPPSIPPVLGLIEVIVACAASGETSEEVPAGPSPMAFVAVTLNT
jgi:hypothetical protein